MKKTLFLSALLSMLPHLHAAVGDTLDLTQGFVAEGVDATFASGGMTFDKTALQTSTRFFDSTKGWSEIIQNSAGDSKMCWAHTAGNMLQYWQSYYGVFYKGNYGELPYGTDYKRTINPNIGASYIITDPMRLNTTKHLITVGFNLSNTGGNVYAGIDYYFCRHQSGGGYYSEYFGAFNNSVSIPSGQTSTVTVVNSQDNLTPALLSAMGITKQSDGTYKQTEAGLIAHLNVGADAGNSFSAHTLTCYGLTLDENGNVKSIIYADSDNSQLSGIESSENIGNAYMGGIPSIEQAYVKVEGGKVLLYTDAACETPLTYGTDYHYYLGAVTQINTPQVLKNMLAEYSDVDNEAQVWNGKNEGTWKALTTTPDTNELPTEATGWDINVDGAAIAEEHRGYYHTYSTDGRDVEFGAHAAEDKRNVTIVGKVTAQNINVTATGYSFLAGEGAELTATEGGGTLNIRSGASLSSEVALTERDILLENGALLELLNQTSVQLQDVTLQDVTLQGCATISASAENATILVSGKFVATTGGTAATPATFALRSVSLEPNVNANLDLTEAEAVTLDCNVNMNGHELHLSKNTPFTLTPTDENAIFFSNIKTLYIDGQEIASSTELTDLLNINITNQASYPDFALVFADGAIALVPEPATATLSLLALASLAARRHRR